MTSKLERLYCIQPMDIRNTLLPPECATWSFGPMVRMVWMIVPSIVKCVYPSLSFLPFLYLQKGNPNHRLIPVLPQYEWISAVPLTGSWYIEFFLLQNGPQNSSKNQSKKQTKKQTKNKQKNKQKTNINKQKKTVR